MNDTQQEVFVSNPNTGMATPLPFRPGMTVADAFAAEFPDQNIGDFTAKVQRQPSGPSTELLPEQVVVFTPSKVAGGTNETRA